MSPGSRVNQFMEEKGGPGGASEGEVLGLSVLGFPHLLVEEAGEDVSAVGEAL